MRFFLALGWLIVASAFAVTSCTSGSNKPDAGGAVDAGSPDAGTPSDGGPLPDGGVPCNQQALGPTTCGVAGGLECPRGKVCLSNTCVDSTGSRPQARSDHQMVYDSTRNRIILFGGDTMGTVNMLERPTFTNDTWSFDIGTQQWEMLTPTGPPEARGGYAAVLAGRKWIIFGGRSGTFGTLRLHNDVWSYDLDTDSWTRLVEDKPKATNPNVPTERHRGALAYDSTNNRLLVFGGSSDPVTFGLLTHNDMWAFDIGTQAWSSVAPTSPWPTPRQSMAVAHDHANGRMYMFSGARDGQTLLDEIWRFDIATTTWESYQTTGAPATPEFAKYGAAMAFEPNSNRLFVFGGRTNNAVARRNTLWRFEIQTRAWTSITQGDPALRVPDCRAPERRDEHAVVFIQAQNRVVLFGGESDCALIDDLWYFGVGSSAWSNPFVATGGETCERTTMACFGICQ